jgi:competence protein ComEC
VTSSQLAMLNVGQGDCFVVHDPKCATAAIIDCPFDGRNVALEFIRTKGITTIKGVVVTHLHDDHYGGIPHLLANVRPESLFYGIAYGYQRAHPEADAFLKSMLIAIRRNNISDYGLARGGQQIAFGDVEITLLGPNDQEVMKAQPANNPNHASAIMRVRCGRMTAVLGGDATPWRWKALLDRGEALAADVLVVPHHAARFVHRLLPIPELLAAVRPRVILVSVGSANNYGHPDRATLQALRAYAQEHGARLICSQLNEICRIGAARAGAGGKAVPCAGTVVVSDVGGVVDVTTETSQHREIVDGRISPMPSQKPLSFPQCAPVPVGAP